MNEQLVAKLAAYVPDQATIDLVTATPILLLVGPTGAGKDALKQELLVTGQYHHIVSHTTRPPRINQGVLEQEGREYHFIDLKQAERMLAEHKFIEAARVHNNVYGTSVAEIQAAHDEGKTAVTDLDVQGVNVYKSIDPGVMAIFLLPPDFTTWQERIKRRYGDTVNEADMKVRMQTALNELDQLLTTDYYFAVTNRVLAETVEEVRVITATHEHDQELEATARAEAQKLSAAIQDYLNHTA